ncbi:VOC family protein [Streptomyces sp. NPDC001770]
MGLRSPTDYVPGTGTPSPRRASPQEAAACRQMPRHTSASHVRRGTYGPPNGSGVRRPDLRAAERFWGPGLGLDILYQHDADPVAGRRHSLPMAGRPGATWHLELAHDPAAPVEPRPNPEGLLVVHLGEPVPDALVERLERHGGERVPAHSPYWDTWGVTVRDPDGVPAGPLHAHVGQLVS